MQKSEFENGNIKDHGHLRPDEISDDEYFMDIARVVGEKGTCDRGRSGCVIVRDGQVLSTGFVQAPQGSPSCDHLWHQMREIKKDTWEITQHCMRNCCAELSAITAAARQGIKLDGATLYTKMTPCYIRHCVHLVVASGIKRVVCEKHFHDAQLSEEILKNAWVELVYLEQGIENYNTPSPNNNHLQK